MEFDINRVEESMRTLVVQQLGDKFGYDSGLNELESYAPNELAFNQIEPLENLIRNALNYDSLVYKEALGISQPNIGEPNGVLKS